MNLILLSAEEARRQPVTLTGERADHLRKVLRCAPGDTLRVGILDGPLGAATVLRVEERRVVLECRFETGVPARSEDTLLLAVPRPIVLRRCLSAAAALGFGRIVLFRSRHVDKNHLDSKVLDEGIVARQLVDGLSQARRTRLPEVETFLRFRPFVEDHLDRLAARGNRFVAHPAAAQDLAATEVEPRPFTLALGPERGFVGFEVGLLAEAGFVPVSAGPHPLRVETALASIAGQLDLLRRRGPGGGRPLG